MAMTYTSLVAPKGTTGSLANWVGYSKLDTETVLDEAQSLLFQLLRVREMRKTWIFGLAVGESEKALPTRFLDPIGRIRDLTNTINLPHRLDTEVENARSYEQIASADFAADPFTTTTDSTLVAVELVGHDLTQGSALTISEADAVGGRTLDGSVPVTSITDADNLVIDAGSAASSGATGGGALATYTANKLIESTPVIWSIYDEAVKFNSAADQAAQYKMLYFQSPALLSATNLSNWVTNRYPKLLRAACMAAAADFMKDDTEYQKHLTALTALVGSTAAENDLMFRGAEFGTDTPTPGDYY